MTKFIKALVLTTILSLGVYGVVQAFLTDTEESTGNYVQASTINLQVGESDPSVYSFSFPDVLPGEIAVTETTIQSNGRATGNFWLEIGGSNSQEGENPESETETTGEGELLDCAEVRLSFIDSQENETLLFDFMPLGTAMADYDYDQLDSSIDQMVNVSQARMKLQLRTDSCGNDAMGDSFDVDMVFHLDQV